MTAPRQVIAGRTYLLTRRCTQRQFLLRPDARVEQTYLYCLGEASARYGITLHGWIAMSNHQHLVVTDHGGNFPAFLAHLNKMIAKALNARWGRCENFWATEQPNAVYLVDPQDRFDKLIYLLANPVAEDLVERVSDWPGASSFSLHVSGSPKTVKRPKGFFRHDGPMPEEVTLRAEPLDGFSASDRTDWAAKVLAAVRVEEEKARKRRAANRLRVLGRKAVLRAAHTDRPTTIAPRGRLRPQVACRSSTRRNRALSAMQKFRSDYRDALVKLRAGNRDVVFPAGTYLMQILGMRVSAPSEPSWGAAEPQAS